MTGLPTRLRALAQAEAGSAAVLEEAAAGRCRTCRHWQQDGPTAGPCAVLAVMPLGNQVRYVNLQDAGTYPFPLEVPFRTPPDFGCIKHEMAP